jgi:hypothetical protein
MGQHVERDAGRGLDLSHDGCRITGTADRLGPHERDRCSVQGARGGRIPAHRSDELLTRRRAEVSLRVDGRTKPEENRFIGQRAEPMAGDRRDEEMDGIGT